MQKKKLLLLSAIVLLMGTNSYGTLYPDQDNQTDPKKDEIITQEMIEGHLKDDTVVSVKEGKYTIISDNVNVDVTNSDKTVDKKIININSESNQSLVSENNGILKGTNNGGKSFVVVNVQSGNFKNNGTIEINGTGGKGIALNGNKDSSVVNEGTIIAGKNSETGEITKQVEGVNVNNSNGSFTNKGLIETYGENTKGIAVYKGTATNEGTIIAREKSAGVYLANTNGTFANEANGTIIADGKGAKAIQFGAGAKNATNKGTIIAQNSADGIFLSADEVDFTNKETGIISAIGADSRAINLNNKSAKATNNGIIEVSGGATAVNNKGTFTNNKTIQGDGIGVKLSGGILVNSGTIDTTRNAIESYSGTNNTVYLKNGSKINGKIVGNTGVDILALEGNNEGNAGEYSNLNVSNYEAITVKNGNATISNSTIGLGNHKDTNKYLNESNGKLDEIESGSNKSNGTLTLNNSNLVIDMSNKGTSSNGSGLLNGGNVKFDGEMRLGFASKNGERNFNIDDGLDILGLAEEQKKDLKDSLTDSAVWSYNDDKTVATKNYYRDVITTSYLTDFANKVDGKLKDGDLKNYLTQLEFSNSAKQFTKGLAQVSGGIHGYTVDIAAINSRTLVNTMKNRAMSREYLTTRPVNTWAQDVIYLDGNHRMNGLMSASYNENGILGVTEKQVYPNARLGFIYGGSNGKAKFDGGNSGDISTTNTYIGGYYNYDFNNNLSLNTNFAFVYGHNRVNRKVNIGNFSEELKSHYPTYAMGVGTSAIYTVKDDMKNKASFYAGIDVNRIMQGNINEKEEIKIGSNDNLMVKNGGANEFSYYSITPSAGFMVQNTGYVFDKKYLVGADLAWETELGNIKDGKRLKMQGIADQYKVGTMERENIFSTSIFGQIDLTESLALNGRYSASISDNYNSDLVTLGMTYKMDTFADNFVVGPFLSGLENNKFTSDRWSGTFAFMFENEDDSDRVYYNSVGDLTSGDYATSMKIKPKFTLSLRDKKSKWSYYFEGYYMANNFLKDTKAGEADQNATRIHGEARWNDSYSKGRYGFNVGYRNETSDKPVAYQYTEGERTTRGVHQLRLTPNFSYNLGSGFRLDMKTTGVFEYNYTGVREGQMDFLMENEHNLVYTGFMPRWQLRMGYYREDRWMDNDSNKLGWDNTLKAVTEQVGVGRYQMNQLRPSATYYFGNGDSMTFALRVPLGNGAWYNSLNDNKKDSESYETRYTVNYNHVVVPGFNIFGELTFLDLKTKVTKENDRKVTRAYSFRPTVGFSYSF